MLAALAQSGSIAKLWFDLPLGAAADPQPRVVDLPRTSGIRPPVAGYCRLDLGDLVPDHSTFSKNRHGRFCDSDLFRRLFEQVGARCIAEGLVEGDSFGVDASIIQAEPSRYTKVEAAEWSAPEKVTRATQEYLDTLDDAAFGGATPAQPRTLSPSDPSARFTGANGDRAFFAYSANYLVDL